MPSDTIRYDTLRFMESSKTTASHIAISVTQILNYTDNSTIGTERQTQSYLGFALLLMSAAGIVGNSMVLIAVWCVKVLQQPTNKILCSLAVADLLVCILVMPPAAGQLATGSWTIGIPACSLFIFLDVCLCTSSILHICTISIDRCVGVMRPMATRASGRGSRQLIVKLAIVWTYSIATASPIFIYASADSKSVYDQGICTLHKRDFQVYGSFLAFYIPVIVMFVALILTTRLLHKLDRIHKTNCKNGAMRRMHGGSKLLRVPISKAGESGHNSSESLSPFKESTPSQTEVEIENENSSLVNGRLSVKDHSDRIMHVRKKYIGLKLSRNRLPVENLRTNKQTPSKADLKFKKTNTMGGVVWKHNRILQRNASRLNLRKEKYGIKHVSRERKASKVLKIVFAAFLVCWGPFFLLNIIQGISPSIYIEPVVLDIVLWLGYCSSIVNPIIYTIINKEFQRAFHNILTCRLWKCKGIKRQQSHKSNSGSAYEVRKSAIVVTNSNGTSKHHLNNPTNNDLLR